MQLNRNEQVCKRTAMIIFQGRNGQETEREMAESVR